MRKLVDRDGFVVAGCWEKATNLVVKDKVYLIVDRTHQDKNLNEVQQLHKKGELNVHDPVWHHFPATKEQPQGMLKVFPSIAQQWKNQMNKKYIKPHTHKLDNVDSSKFHVILSKYRYEFSESK